MFLLMAASAALAGCLSSDKVSEPSIPSGNPPPPTGNSAPTISGTPPPAVTVGSNYSFTPVASDADGDPLTFSVQNPPAWASFDPATGELSGVAPLGMEGTYPSIRITVSDGSLSASTGLFSVEVTQVALGSATLSWTPPTANADGSPLMDLASYRIYYGTAPGTYPNTITVSNPGLASYVVTDLVPNTYYFVSTSVNASGIESSFSNMASKTIN